MKANVIPRSFAISRIFDMFPDDFSIEKIPPNYKKQKKYEKSPEKVFTILRYSSIMRTEKVIKYHLDNTIKVVKNQHFGGTKNGNHEKVHRNLLERQPAAEGWRL
nr:MAG TPA: hypothetical protein [Caudoviricetes sp.]